MSALQLILSSGGWGLAAGLAVALGITLWILSVILGILKRGDSRPPPVAGEIVEYQPGRRGGING